MNRTEKQTEVAELQERFQRASVALIATEQGLDVSAVQRLRRDLRKVGGEYKVAKNTLAKLAIRETSYGGLAPALKGPTGIVFGYSDPVSVTKVLVKFARDNDKLSITSAVLDNNVLAPPDIQQLAELPSRETLLAQLLGLIQAPATELVRLIQEPGARVARLLDAVRIRLEAN